MLKLIKVNVLSVIVHAAGLCVRTYAGRNQIGLFAAAGRCSETDGGSTCCCRWSEGYWFQLRAERNENVS